MVVTGLNTRSRYVTPCSLRTSRMLASVKISAKGSPSLRAKRARTASKLVMELFSPSWVEVVGTPVRGKDLGTRERPGDERQSQESTPKRPLLWYRCDQVGR